MTGVIAGLTLAMPWAAFMAGQAYVCHRVKRELRKWGTTRGGESTCAAIAKVVAA